MARARSLPTLFVMVKAPIAGAVKTRLARRIGTTETLRFYRTVTASLLRRLALDRRWHTILAVTPDIHIASRFWPARHGRVGQGRGDLGARMQRLLGFPGNGSVVIIGSDIPDIRPRHIAEAFHLARRYGVVFGAAIDGGYWLVGARRRPTTPRPFLGVRWASQHALADTLANISGVVGHCAVLADVDTEVEWRRWRRTGFVSPKPNGDRV